MSILSALAKLCKASFNKSTSFFTKHANTFTKKAASFVSNQLWPILFTPFKLAHNAVVMRRLGQDIGQSAALTPAPNVGGTQEGSEQSDRPTGVEPQATVGSDAHNVSYVQVCQPVDPVEFAYNKLKKAVWLVKVFDDGLLHRFSGAVSGNKTYCYNAEKALLYSVARRGWKQKTATHIILTKKYDKTPEGRRDSWLAFKQELPAFLRKARRHGYTQWLRVLEAHVDGGCHCHLLFFLNDEQSALPMPASLTECWDGGVYANKVNGCDGIDYLLKTIGANGHVEYAVERALRDWRNKGDRPYKKVDQQKLWALYFSSTLGMRRYAYSKELKGHDGDDNVEMMSTYSSKNSRKENEPETPKAKRVYVLPKAVVNCKWFKPYNGIVSAGSLEHGFLMEFLEQVIADSPKQRPPPE